VGVIVIILVEVNALWKIMNKIKGNRIMDIFSKKSYAATPITKHHVFSCFLPIVP
jgi:hypothetical protein